MSFHDVLASVPFQPDKKRKKNKSWLKNVVKAESKVDTSDVSHIKDAICKMLEYLNGKGYTKHYSVSVTDRINISEDRQCCFRAKVYDKRDKIVLIDFFVEKTSEKEYVFSPPLNSNAFTVNSYANRNIFRKSEEAAR